MSDDIDTGDEDEEPVVDAGGGKEADGVEGVRESDDDDAEAEAEVAEDDE